MKNNVNEQIYLIYVGKKSLTLNSLSTKQYAEAVQLSSILIETTKIFFRKNGLSPQQAIQEYLTQSNKGEHVLLKSFGSFNKSTINRMCFLFNFIKIFEIQNHQRNGIDYYQLLRLLCSDFPKDIVTKSVNLVNDQPNQDFTKILNSRKFVNAFYLNFIHTEYLQSLFNQVFENKNEKVPIFILAEWVLQKQQSLVKHYDKPLFSSAIQSILNQIRKKGVINQISSSHNFPSMKDSNLNKKILFLNQKNCLDYIQTQCPYRGTLKRLNKNKEEHSSDEDPQSQKSADQENQLNSKIVDSSPHNKISYEEFLKQLINQVQYHKWIKENIQMFENSIIWAVETYKILNAKETGQPPQPINQKKMKKK